MCISRGYCCSIAILHAIRGHHGLWGRGTVVAQPVLPGSCGFCDRLPDVEQLSQREDGEIERYQDAPHNRSDGDNQNRNLAQECSSGADPRRIVGGAVLCVLTVHGLYDGTFFHAQPVCSLAVALALWLTPGGGEEHERGTPPSLRATSPVRIGFSKEAPLTGELSPQVTERVSFCPAHRR